MKKVCQKCGSTRLHKHGAKRRKCADCGVTCSIKSGRKRSKIQAMYILDRSTMRRIGRKRKKTHQTVLYHLYRELVDVPTVLSGIKKTFSMHRHCFH